MKALNPAKYSFSWAETIVAKATEKYPRGATLIKNMLLVTDRDMAAYLAHGDDMWPKLRSMMSKGEDLLKNNTRLGATTVLISWCRLTFSPEMKERFEYALTTRQKRLRIEEQGLIQGREEANADERHQLLLPFLEDIDGLT
jgi:hypothetical protein